MHKGAHTTRKYAGAPERERERERQTDRQTDRPTETETDRQTDRGFRRSAIDESYPAI